LEIRVLMVIRFFALATSVASVHLLDGLAFAALVFGALIGLLAVRFYWLALPAAGLANLSNLIYAESTGAGKMEGALGRFPVEFPVFLVLTVLGFLLGIWARHVLYARSQRSAAQSAKTLPPDDKIED